MTAAQPSSRCAPSATVQLGGAIRRVARASGNILHETVSSLLAGRFTRGDIVAGIIAALQTVSLAGGTSATTTTAATTDGIERLVATIQSSRRAPSATV